MAAPEFSVTAIGDGQRFGILIEKHDLPDGTGPKEYFTTDNNNALPSPPGVTNRGIPWTRLRIGFHLLLAELYAYTSSVSDTAPPYPALHTTQRYKYEKGYPTYLSDLFHNNKDSRFWKLFGTAEVFRASVFHTVSGQQKIQGRARRFLFVRPEQVFPEDRLEDLRHADEFLGFKQRKEPEWFRLDGPIAVDFTHDRVYRPAILDSIISSVTEHQVSLLLGDMASGKTVLARYIAFLTYNQCPTYYFRYRPFQPGSLLDQVCSVAGFVILEDAHLDPHGFQEVCARVQPDWNVRILVTARPSLLKSETSHWPKLSKLPTTTLRPRQQIDALISHVSQRLRPELPWREQHITGIKDVAGSNLWLLAFALKGCADKEGEGTPKQWIADGVTTRLRALEQMKSVYPSILVAMSPLGSFEEPVAENFLVRTCGASPDDLNDLVNHGEILREVWQDGHVLYRLPHAALAEGYWEHGLEYRRRCSLPNIAECLEQYAASETPNALTALGHYYCRSCEAARDVRDGLYISGTISDCVRSEACTASLVMLTQLAPPMPAHFSTYLESLVSAVERRGSALEAATLLAHYLDSNPILGFCIAQLVSSERLASLIASAEDLRHSMSLLAVLATIPTAEAVVSAVPLSDLARRGRQDDSAAFALTICDILSGIDMEAASTFADLIDKPSQEARLDELLFEEARRDRNIGHLLKRRTHKIWWLYSENSRIASRANACPSLARALVQTYDIEAILAREGRPTISQKAQILEEIANSRYSACLMPQLVRQVDIGAMSAFLSENPHHWCRWLSAITSALPAEEKSRVLQQVSDATLRDLERDTAADAMIDLLVRLCAISPELATRGLRAWGTSQHLSSLSREARDPVSTVSSMLILHNRPGRAFASSWDLTELLDRTPTDAGRGAVRWALTQLYIADEATGHMVSESMVDRELVKDIEAFCSGMNRKGLQDTLLRQLRGDYKAEPVGSPDSLLRPIDILT